MKYIVSINKKYRYIKVYKIVKKIGQQENKLSIAFSKLIDKLISKNQQSSQQ
ncbi:MAG: hypothetical protein ACP5GD_01365 [Candidatus Micrarchaeia archaeon]|jgi:hypothetical protein